MMIVGVKLCLFHLKIILSSFTLQGVENARELDAHRICLMTNDGLALTWRSIVWEEPLADKD